MAKINGDLVVVGAMDEGDEFLIKFEVPTVITSPISISIPQTATHLQVQMQCRSTQATNLENIYIQFNGDTGANYDEMNKTFTWTGTSGQAEALAGTEILIGSGGGTISDPVNIGGVHHFDVWDYRSTSKYKTAFGSHGHLRDLDLGTIRNRGLVSHFGGTWRSTAAITSIEFLTQTNSNPWNVGSTFWIKGYN